MFKKLLLIKNTNSKHLVFVAIMAAIGNVLSGISIYSAPLIPSIPFGAISISLAFDLSHISTFISAIIGGPIVGAATGFMGGAIAAYEFGFSKGNFITGFGLPVGKAITGAIAGWFMSDFSFLKKDKNPIYFVPATLLLYLPEAIYTALLFIVVFPIAFNLPISVVYLFTTQVLVKAFFEMVFSGFIVATLVSNKGFNAFVNTVFPKSKYKNHESS